MALTQHQRSFLAAYRRFGNISAAARTVPIDRTRHYDWFKNSEEYREAFDDAQEEANDRLEEAARKRAVVGTRRMKFTKHGDPIRDPRKAPNDPDPWYYETDYSDNILMRLLMAHRPGKFSNKIDQCVSGPGGGPLEHNHAIRQIALANPELASHLCLALEQATLIHGGATADSDDPGSDGDTSSVCVDDE